MSGWCPWRAWARLVGRVTRADPDRDLDDETEFHLAMEARKHALNGLDEAEARRRARLSFGGVARVQEECRDQRRWAALETIRRDVVDAVRGFRRDRGFTLTVVLTIGLGLGLNAALFSVFNHYVLRPLAIRDPYRVYALSWQDAGGRAHSFSWQEFEQLRQDRTAFDEVAATRFLVSRIDGHPMQGQFVTGNYFQLLGVKPALGRTLLPDDTRVPLQGFVLVLSYAAWQDSFAGDVRILGRTLHVHGVPFEVIGVAQPGFDDLGDTPIQYWAPLTAAPVVDGAGDFFSSPRPEVVRILGRLRPSLTAAQARVGLATRMRVMTASAPLSERSAGVLLQSKATAVTLSGELVAVGAPLAGAFALVMLLASANVANMLLARGMSRQRELGIRVSLGASRGRLIRQLVTESILLALAAAALGVVLSEALIAGAIRIMFDTMPADLAQIIHTEPIHVDLRVFAFTLGAALTAVLAFGVLPAFRVTRGDIWSATRGQLSSTVSANRLRGLLATGQVGVCILLILTAGILLRTATAIRRFDVGFKTSGTVVIRANDASHGRVLAALTARADVRGLAGAASTPSNGMLPSLIVSAPDRHVSLGTWYNDISPLYFDLIGVPIVAGRRFSNEEAAAGSPVAIVSRSTARQLWPGAHAVGRELLIRAESARSRGLPPYASVRVVGVADDLVTCCVVLGKDPAIIYFPAPPTRPGLSLVVGVPGDADRAAHQLEADLAMLAPGAVEEVHALEQYVAAGVYPFQAASWIVLALAGLALTLTVTGIYGVIAYIVAQRTKEIGIRVAIGATSSAVVRLVLQHSLVIASVGLVGGMSVALMAGLLLRARLPFVNPLDLAVFAVGGVVVLLTALAGGAIPALRASRIDPILTLRND